MKKLLALVLALCMVLALAACGSGSDSGDAAQDAAESTPAGDETAAVLQPVAPAVTPGTPLRMQRRALLLVTRPQRRMPVLMCIP